MKSATEYLWFNTKQHREYVNITDAVEEIVLCGGGAHNRQLVESIRAASAPIPVCTTETLGLHPDWVEAAAFAWLARQHLTGQPGKDSQ